MQMSKTPIVLSIQSIHNCKHSAYISQDLGIQEVSRLAIGLQDKILIHFSDVLTICWFHVMLTSTEAHTDFQYQRFCNGVDWDRISRFFKVVTLYI